MSIGLSLGLAWNWAAVGDSDDEGGSGGNALGAPDCERDVTAVLLREIMKVTESGELWEGGRDGEESCEVSLREVSVRVVLWGDIEVARRADGGVPTC